MFLKLLGYPYERNLITILRPLMSRDVSTTVDPKEIDHHVKLSDRWWDEDHGPMVPLHSMNRLRVPFIRNGLINAQKVAPKAQGRADCLKGVKILDVGCGGGILSLPLARLGGQVVGLDASPELIECARNHAKLNLGANNLEYICSTIEDFSETNKERFDAVVISEIIEHVTAKDLFLKSVYDVLKPGGSLFTTTINKTYASWIGAIILAENIFRLLPAGIHDWDKFISVQDLTHKLEEVGCRTISVQGMCYTPFLNSWQWSNNTSINYAVHSLKRS